MSTIRRTRTRPGPGEKAVTLTPVFASALGQIFQPLFQAMAWLIASFYAVIPNYAIAIAILTVVVMIVTAPLTVKSTRSMVAMQRLAPEMKKLQAKYKGDKQKLNEEMMALYREHGVNPAGGCLPMLIQFPIFIILYDVIRGLTNTVKASTATKSYYYTALNGQLTKCEGPNPCAAPRYIGYHTKLYASLLHNNGKMPAFGIDLAAKLLGQHSVVHAIPYALLIWVAIGLQYLQMRQLNSRNPQMAQANPQAQMMQRYMPILFAIIYINIAAGVNVYFIVSSLCRIGIQEGVFRSGLLSRPAGKPSEEVIPGRGGETPRRRTFMEKLADAQKRALEQQERQRTQKEAIERETSRATPAGSGDGSGIPGNGPPSPKRPGASAPPRRQAGSGGSTKGANGASPNGAENKSPNGSSDAGEGQSRSKDQRGKKAR